MRAIARNSDLRDLQKLPPTPKEGPLDLIAEDRRRKVKPVKREAHRRYSPLKDHVSRIVGLNIEANNPWVRACENALVVR